MLETLKKDIFSHWICQAETRKPLYKNGAVDVNLTAQLKLSTGEQIKPFKSKTYPSKMTF